jgi:DNA polymerase-4
MKSMGLHTGADLKQLPEEELVRRFGKSGHFYYQVVRGIDNRAVQPHRETKSMGAEDTFPHDMTTTEEMYPELEKIARIVSDRLGKYQLKGRTITLKIKYSDFRLITRSQSLPHTVNDYDTILATSQKLLLDSNLDNVRVRLLGISLSNFNETASSGTKPGSHQLSLFDQ